MSDIYLESTKLIMYWVKDKRGSALLLSKSSYTASTFVIVHHWLVQPVSAQQPPDHALLTQNHVFSPALRPSQQDCKRSLCGTSYAT